MPLSALLCCPALLLLLLFLPLLQAWGVMEFQLGRYDEARRLFQEGVWADPGNTDVVFIFQVRLLLCCAVY